MKVYAIKKQSTDQLTRMRNGWYRHIWDDYYYGSFPVRQIFYRNLRFARKMLEIQKEKYLDETVELVEFEVEELGVIE